MILSIIFEVLRVEGGIAMLSYLTEVIAGNPIDSKYHFAVKTQTACFWLDFIIHKFLLLRSPSKQT